MSWILLILIFIFILYVIKTFWFGNKSKKRTFPSFPETWKTILNEKIVFYSSLSIHEKELFEFKIQEFLANIKIIGVDTDINITDKLLVASSAIIPIFKFENWIYPNIEEIIIYPDRFNHQFERSGKGRNILGMVGTHYMDGKMILSKKALHLGFENETDKRNTAIHEFVHLIDKVDGSIDGIPEVLLQKQYILPWIELIKQKLEELQTNKSDIDAYAGLNPAEFYAVVSEYFFERPKLLSQKHPQLYRILKQMFQHNMSKRNLFRVRKTLGRNEPCICRSGLKYKQCCLHKI